MTIALDTEIVASRFDPATRKASYTIERNGKRWTVTIHADEFEKHKNNHAARRTHLANTLQNAMNGPPDA